MKQLLFVVTLFSLCSISYSQSFSGPESVEFDALNNRYLVSNKGAVKSIQSVVPGQAPVLFTSNVTSPAGLEILGNKLSPVQSLVHAIWAADAMDKGMTHRQAILGLLKSHQ